jgi:hypothetical protein
LASIQNAARQMARPDTPKMQYVGETYIQRKDAAKKALANG